MFFDSLNGDFIDEDMNEARDDFSLHIDNLYCDETEEVRLKIKRLISYYLRSCDHLNTNQRKYKWSKVIVKDGDSYGGIFQMRQSKTELYHTVWKLCDKVSKGNNREHLDTVLLQI